MDRQQRPRRRLRSLLPRETGPRRPRRRSLARVEQEPDGYEVDSVEATAAGYDWESVRRNYSSWGCNAPPPPDRRMD